MPNIMGIAYFTGLLFVYYGGIFKNMFSWALLVCECRHAFLGFHFFLTYSTFQLQTPLLPVLQVHPYLLSHHSDPLFLCFTSEKSRPPRDISQT